MSTDADDNLLLIIGVSGVTCGGKTTTATQLKDMLPNTTVLCQDDYYLDEKDPRHIWIPVLNHINFDIITSLDMEKMYNDILHFITANNLKQVNHMDQNYVFNNGTSHISQIHAICDMMKSLKLNILIIEGFAIFNYHPMINLFNLKYYFTLDREECFKRRLQRVYEPPDCPGYFEKCVWPEYLNQLEEVKRTVKDVKYFDGNSINSVDKILKDICTYIQKACS